MLKVCMYLIPPKNFYLQNPKSVASIARFETPEMILNICETTWQNKLCKLIMEKFYKFRTINHLT